VRESRHGGRVDVVGQEVVEDRRGAVHALDAEIAEPCRDPHDVDAIHRHAHPAGEEALDRPEDLHVQDRERQAHALDQWGRLGRGDGRSGQHHVVLAVHDTLGSARGAARVGDGGGSVRVARVRVERGGLSVGPPTAGAVRIDLDQPQAGHEIGEGGRRRALGDQDPRVAVAHQEHLFGRGEVGVDADPDEPAPHRREVGDDDVDGVR